MAEIALYVLVFLATVLAIEGIFLALRAGRDRDRATARERLGRLTSELLAPEVPDEASVLRDEDRKFGNLLAGLWPKAVSLDLLIYRAGAPYNTRRFIVGSVLLAVASVAIAALFLREPIFALAFSLAGFLPYAHLRHLASKRVGEFEKQFPDAISLLTRAMRAGHSLGFGFEMIGEELPDPVGTEFRHVSEEVKLGQDVAVALANLAYRMPAEDLPFFVTAVGIQRETGGNLTEVLDKLAHVIRERFKLYGKVRAFTAMGKASANLLALWPFVMVGALFMVNREYVAPLWETDAGHWMALISTAMVVVGYAICRRIAIIKV